LARRPHDAHPSSSRSLQVSPPDAVRTVPRDRYLVTHANVKKANKQAPIAIQIHIDISIPCPRFPLGRSSWHFASVCSTVLRYLRIRQTKLRSVLSQPERHQPLRGRKLGRKAPPMSVLQ
jgi:hypothetical protein